MTGILLNHLKRMSIWLPRKENYPWGPYLIIPMVLEVLKARSHGSGLQKEESQLLVREFLETCNKTCSLVRQGNIPKYSTDDTWWSCTVFSISLLNTFQTAGNQGIKLWDNRSHEDLHCTLNSLGNLSFCSALVAPQRKMFVCCRIQHFLVQRQKRKHKLQNMVRKMQGILTKSRPWFRVNNPKCTIHEHGHQKVTRSHISLIFGVSEGQKWR